MKKIFCLALSFTLLASPAVYGFDATDIGNIDVIMEDNALTDVENRYAALQLSYFPETATRLGFDSADNKLDNRDDERDIQVLRALNIVQESLKNINRKMLSEPKKTEYDMLAGRIVMDTYHARNERPALDPILYSSVFSALYDLRMKELTFQDLQDRDLATRVAALPRVAQQATDNLTAPPSFLSQLAMEDAYYAYLSFDTIAQYLIARAHDDVSRTQVTNDSKEAKKAIKSMFELFKKLAQDNEQQDFRLGEKAYEIFLQNYYFIPTKLKNLEKQLNKNFRTAQENLAKALEAFAAAEPVQNVADLVIENIQVPGEEKTETEAVTVTPIEQPVQQMPKKNNKRDKNMPLVTAAEFYAAAQRLTEDITNQNFIVLLVQEASQLGQSYAKDEVLPTSNTAFKLKEMPQYYTYSRAYLFMPPFGMQSNPISELYLRLPAGNSVTTQEMLNRDFNTPTLKLLVAGQMIPGLAYRTAYNWNRLSPFRKQYSVPTLRNGWEVYAQHLANERGYILTDDEQLYLAWADYVRAAQAVLDFNLHTQRFTYAQAFQWLTELHGFSKEQAETMLKQVAIQPGEAVSYIYGYEALKNVRAKYQKKLGKKFVLADFHAKVMSLGDIPPNRLEPEIENFYAIEKHNLTQALSTPFYMN